MRWCIVLIDFSVSSQRNGPIKICVFFFVSRNNKFFDYFLKISIFSIHMLVQTSQVFAETVTYYLW